MLAGKQPECGAERALAVGGRRAQAFGAGHAVAHLRHQGAFHAGDEQAGAQQVARREVRVFGQYRVDGGQRVDIVGIEKRQGLVVGGSARCGGV